MRKWTNMYASSVAISTIQPWEIRITESHREYLLKTFRMDGYAQFAVLHKVNLSSLNNAGRS